MCGGTDPGVGEVIPKRGLSPRVRGNLYITDSHGRQERSIPACAGEPGRCYPPLAGRRVYPRVCGGTVDGQEYYYMEKGLSPRVRGNLDDVEPGWYLDGSIPACAGEPHRRARVDTVYQVYPRVCGGTALFVHLREKINGLSRVCGGTTPIAGS